MKNTDLIMGLDSAYFNKAITQVYTINSLKSELFSGSNGGQFGGVSVSAQWSIEAAPEISFESATSEEWTKSIKATGITSQIVANSFIVSFPKMDVTISSPGAKSNQTSFPVKAICNAFVKGNRVSLKADSVLVSLSAASPTDQYIVTYILIPKILEMLDTLLSGFTIPTPSIAGVSLTPPVVSIQNGKMILALNLFHRSIPPNPQGPWPDQEQFVLASERLIQTAANYDVSHNLLGTHFNPTKGLSRAGFSATYNYQGHVSTMTLTTTPDPTKLHCRTSVDLTASGGIDIPFDDVLVGGKIVAKSVIRAEKLAQEEAVEKSEAAVAESKKLAQEALTRSRDKLESVGSSIASVFHF